MRRRLRQFFSKSGAGRRNILQQASSAPDRAPAPASASTSARGKESGERGEAAPAEGQGGSDQEDVQDEATGLVLGEGILMSLRPPSPPSPPPGP